jgi:hypothetical protein
MHRALCVAGLLATLTLGCREQTGAPNAGETTDDMTRQWVADQLTTQLALIERAPTSVSPAAVNVYRVDSSHAASMLRVTVMGVSPEREFAVLRLGNEHFPLAGFREPQVKEAWSALWATSRVPCEEVERLILWGLAPRGGAGFLLGDSEATGAGGVVVTAYRDQRARWPSDTAIAVQGRSKLKVVTVLEKERTQIPGRQVWFPTTFSTLVSEPCELLAWDSRTREPLSLPDSGAH